MKNKGFIIIAVLALLLIIFRLLLPSIVLKYVNRVLADIDQYHGHVEDIDIALIRGAYVIKDMKIEKTGDNDTIPFFTTPEIDLSVEWKAIFKGSLVGEIVVNKPHLYFVRGKHKGEDIKADTSDFRDVIRDLMPLKVNHFEILDGQIHYIDKSTSPKVDIAMKNIFAGATNLTNVNDSVKVLPAKLKATGNAYEGTFELNADLNLLEKKPTFDLNARITDVNMVKMNDLFKAYGNFDVSKGNFGLYTEFAARDGAFKGYVKPLIKDLDIVEFNKEEGKPLQILWETVVASVAEIFKNHRKDQLATKVPIEGKFENPDTNLWTAISYVLRNAFIDALTPTIDNTINIKEVEIKDDKKNLLQKVFGKKDKK